MNLKCEVSCDLCEDIAALRRKLQKMDKKRIIFLDETAVRISEAPTSTLVAPGEQSYVIVEDTTTYAERYDMIACINGEQTFAPCVFTPEDRRGYHAQGITNEMLVDYILNIFGQELAALDKPPLTLILDRAAIHNKEKLLEAFNQRGGHVLDIIYMPTQAAKRMSPLDNSLFHIWKERVRKRCPLTKTNIQQIMCDEWNNLKKEDIQPQFRQCRLMIRQDVYDDCPESHDHCH